MHNPLNSLIIQNAQTFSGEHKLPKLPVPSLKATFDLYLSSVKAKFSDTSKIEKKISEFLDSEESTKLQKELFLRFEKTHNWLHTIWLEEIYLKCREPLIPFLNISGKSSLSQTIWPIIPLKNLDASFSNEIIRRCANYIYCTMKLFIILRNSYLIPNMSKNNKPLSMIQFKYFFNTSRIPHDSVDIVLNKFKLIEHGDCPEHIIVACNGRLFSVDLKTYKNQIFSIQQITYVLKNIVDFSELHGEGQCISSLTSLPRTEWASYRHNLRNVSTENAVNVDLIESALFWINLDVTQPPHQLMMLEKALKVDCRNIWADKSICMSFLKDGTITWCADHSLMDGVAIGLNITIIESMIKHGNGSAKCDDIRLLNIPDIIDHQIKWSEIVFHVNKTIQEKIYVATQDYVIRCKKLEANIFQFNTFTRSYARHLKMHPDTLFQLCLQLAYSRIYGVEKLASVYETATTRSFQYGRTETIRSCTIQCKEWIKSITKHGADHLDTVRLFVSAHDAHNKLRSLCENGYGCDRHLLGLISISSSEEFFSPKLMEIIQDETWKSTGGSGSFKLSTSPVGASDIMGAVAPMCEGGFGVFYRIMEDFCEVAITSWVEDDIGGKGASLLQHLNNSFALLPIMHTVLVSISKL